MAEFWVQIVQTIGVVFGGYFAMRAASFGKKTNDAVNHTHQNDEPRIYDIAINNQQQLKEIISWKKRIHEKLERIERSSKNES